MSSPGTPTTSNAAPSVNFDVAGARNAGYTDSQIADYLGSKANFDVNGAVKAGYGYDEIISHLAPPPPLPKEAPPQSSPADTSSAGGAFGRGLERGALPAAGGFAGFSAAAAAAQPVVAPVAAMTGPLAPVTEAAGTLLAGAAGAYGGAEVASEAQQWALDHMPDKFVKALGLDKSQERADVEQHPIASFTGELAPNLALLRPGSVAKVVEEDAPAIEKLLSNPVAARAVPAAIMGAQEAASEESQTGSIDPEKVAIAAGIGAVSNRETALGEKLGRAGAAPVEAAISAVRGHLPAPAPTPMESAAPVMAAGSADDAINAAQTEVDREPIDIEEMAQKATRASAGSELAASAGVDDDLSDFRDETSIMQPGADKRPVAPAVTEQAATPQAEVSAPEEEAPSADEAAEADNGDALGSDETATPDAFDPRAHLTDALSLVRDRSKSLSIPAIADALGLTPEQASRVASILVSSPDTGVTLTRGGGLRRQPVTDAPMDAASLLAAKGGIQNDEGHDLINGRGLQQFVPGKGPLIRKSGMSIDAAGEVLWESGFFGPPDSAPRPSEDDVLQLLEQTRRGDDGRPSKVYAPEDEASVQAIQEGHRAIDQNASVLADIHDYAKSLGEPLTDDEAFQIASEIGAHGLTPESAVDEHIERKAIQGENEGNEDETATPPEPVDTGAAAVDRQSGTGVEGQEPVPFDAGTEAETVHPVTGDTAQEARTREPVDLGRGITAQQDVIPGAERSAVQLAQARENAGHGRVRPTAAQRPADTGLFGSNAEDEPTMFSRRDEEPAPTFYSALARGVEGLKMDKAPPGQWEATIKNLPGIKQEELDWSGINDWLRGQTKSVSKADVLQHLRENEAKKINEESSTAPVHSIPITPSMRESVMQGQPLFQRRSSGVTGTFSPEFDAKREQVSDTLRQRLSDLGLHDVALKLPDAIHADGTGIIDGAYARKIIAISLGAPDHLGTLNHEAVHAARSMGLFTKSEWSILNNRSARDWRPKFDIDGRYSDATEEQRNEEGVAEAFRQWVADQGTQKGTIAAIFDKMRNAFAAIGNVFRGHGFATEDSIFRKLDAGEIGSRNPGTTDAVTTLFSRRSGPQNEEEVYRDQVSGLIDAAGGEGSGDVGFRLLNKISQAGIRQLKNVNGLEGGDYIGTLFPRTLASLDDLSAKLWRPWIARGEEDHAIGEGLRKIISDSLVKLSPESRDHVYAAIELARKWDWRPPDDGRPIRVKNTSYWQARKSKVGDNYVLTQAETKAFHDTMKLGDEGWRTFMGALAKREGWNGPVDPQAIREAANNRGEGIPEGKRLLRLADAIEAAQSAINRPYFPASRFGDYFIAVKPKVSTDKESLGGYPNVEWFETVEKPALQDLLGQSRKSAADVQGVQDALARIKAMKKGDGSIAFPEDKYDFETGDLRSRPNVLRQLNLPAVEKLFMMMERGVTHSLQDKIMQNLAPEGGATPKEAAAIKGEASETAKAAYEALAGHAKDTLLDAVYYDLLSGWKKHAGLVPGYSDDFDRAIGAHIGQVSRNAADIAYRNQIEDAYQNIQDHHPHISTKQYWSHWRSYQENPQNPLAHAAAKTAQIGAAYVMGLNPSTTMMIGAHTPIMAVPVLSVGGGIGQATAQMLRATREVYGALHFDKTNGASIDTSKIGKNDRERAMIAELDRVGLNHSIGADDVRALNDRQAGLWGQAQPKMRKALDIAMSNVSAVDQANRNAIALTAHRMAMNPKTLEKLAAPWMEHSTLFRQMVIDEGLTPESFTKFMMSEAGGAWGKTNQAPAMRGTEGSLLFALHGFQTRFISTAYKLMKNMGPEGRIAAGWMMAALWAGTGIYGLPFTQDLENAAGLLWKRLTGVDPMIDAHVRQFLTDAGFGKIGTEILLRGPLSVVTGVDFGSRMGFGDVLTRSMTSSDLMGTIPSIAWNKLETAWERERSGQGLAAAGAELLPSALRSPARAAIESENGAESKSGVMELPPGQITTAFKIMRSLGLPPLAAEQAYARSEYVYDLRERDMALRQQTERTAANLIMEASRAENDGDHALAHELSDQMSTMLQNYNNSHPTMPVTDQGMNNALLQMTNPEIYRIMKSPPALRGEAMQNPYP